MADHAATVVVAACAAAASLAGCGCNAPPRGCGGYRSLSIEVEDPAVDVTVTGSPGCGTIQGPFYDHAEPQPGWTNFTASLSDSEDRTCTVTVTWGDGKTVTQSVAVGWSKYCDGVVAAENWILIERPA